MAPASYDPFVHGSLGMYVPYLDESMPGMDPEESLELFLSWVESRGLDIWDHQADALMALAMGDHVVLGTPTGSGKSLVALGMCFMAMCAGERAYYTAPIKALVSEKFFELVDILGKDNVGMITGDASINAGAPVICCTAEILANDALRDGENCDVAWVAMDEFHYFGDADRGWAWQVPLLTLPDTQFLLMSATLGDMTSVVDLLRRQTERDVSQILDAPRPVPLSYEFVETPLEATVELALRGGDAPIYIVHFTQDGALKSATALASFGVSTRDQRDQLRDAIAGTRFTTAFGKTLRRLLLTGVGVHHAGMLPRYRLLVERLAQQGLLPVICGTDTLGVGINVPIHTVLMTALAKYDGRRQRRLNAREFHQVAGRAGRAGFDTEGVVIAQATEFDIERARALAKVGGDPKKARKVKTKRPPEGFVGWNRDTFERLVAAQPETLRPRLRVTHAMVLAEVEQGGDARSRVHGIVDASLQTDAEKAALHARADEIFQTLMDAGVVLVESDEDGTDDYYVTIELPEDFALDQPLSPFLLAALELLDPEARADGIANAHVDLSDPDAGGDPHEGEPHAGDPHEDADGESHEDAGGEPHEKEMLQTEACWDARIASDATNEGTGADEDGVREAVFAPDVTSEPDAPEAVMGPVGYTDEMLVRDEGNDDAEVPVRQSGSYALDLISLVESTLEDPRQILVAQERAARDAAMAQMKADGIDYDERIDRLQDVTYPKPLEGLISAAYERYCEEVPWARDYAPSPKSVLRDMLETASDFKGYIQRCGIARCEGILLRYLSDAYRVLARTVPPEKCDERLEEIIAWLGLVVRTVDSSLVDEWAGAGEGAEVDAGAPPEDPDEVVHDRCAVRLLVRNALFARVRMAAVGHFRDLGELDGDWGWREPRWRRAMDDFYEEHEEVLLDADARSADFLLIDESDERTQRVWHVRQTFDDVEGDRDFGIAADVDLDATQEEGTAIFRNYRVGFVEDLLELP